MVRGIEIFSREVLPELPQESVCQHLSETEGAEDMTRRQFKKLADEHYNKDILTPLERRRKALAMKALTKEKIEEVQALIESGVTRKEIAAQACVGLATVDRIKSGQLTAEGKPAKSTPKPPKPEPQTFATLENAKELISPRELDTLRALIGQAVRAFAGIECATPADSYNLGQTFGLLTAVQMILEGDEP